MPEPRARDSREFERQAEWRASATRAMTELQAEEGEGPRRGSDSDTDPDVRAAEGGPEPADGRNGSSTEAPPGEPLSDEDGSTSEASLPEAGMTWAWTNGDAVTRRAGSERAAFEVEEDEEASLIRLADRETLTAPLERLFVLGYGISRKRLEQAIRDLQLPVVAVREPDEADLVITLRNMYKQKSPVIREAEARGIPVYVLKANTVPQMQAVLTSIYALELDPQQLAMRELEEAIGLVRAESKPVELSPQNAFVRRLQHRAAEAANLVSRSRGREPFRRVRVYPDRARAWR